VHILALVFHGLILALVVNGAFGRKDRGMTADAPDLVTLLYRADWTQLSLAAEVSVTTDHDLAELRAETGSDEESQPTGDAWEVATDLQGTEVSRFTLLIAPGGRYRHQGEGFLRGRDGDRSWRVSDDDPGISIAELPSTSWPLDRLLQPSWLLTGFTLEIREPVTTAAGREALRVVATPRRTIRAAREQERPAAEVIVDVELGILLRHAEIVDGRPMRVTELTSVSLNPAGTDDDTQFQPPSGWDGVTEETEPPPPGSIRWGPAKMAADLVADHIGSRVKLPDTFGQATREEPEAAMPEEAPLAPDAAPVSDEILHLLYASENRWAPGIAATMHHWQDMPAAFESSPVWFAQTMGRQLPHIQLHMVFDLRISGPDRYRIEHLLGADRHTSTTTICDGEKCWKILSAETVMVGPAVPLAADTADLLDGSWLLTARLTGGIETTVGGRRGYRVAVAFGDSRRGKHFAPDEVVVDAELGCLLRVISRTGSGPDLRVVMWRELRDITSYAAPAEDFRPDIPAGARLIPEGDVGAMTGLFAREMFKQTRSRVEGFLGFLRGD
jgi:hypothetical protein